MPKPSTPERVQLAVRIPRELHRHLKAHAAAEGRSVAAIVEDALRAALPARVTVKREG